MATSEATGHGPEEPSAPETPTCHHCGYELTGLRVDANCPECGVPIWARANEGRSSPSANQAQRYGVIAIVLTLVIWPLALVFAPLAIGRARRAYREIREGNAPASAAVHARTGQVLGWVSLALIACMIIGFVISTNLDAP